MLSALDNASTAYHIQDVVGYDATTTAALIEEKVQEANAAVLSHDEQAWKLIHHEIEYSIQPDGSKVPLHLKVYRSTDPQHSLRFKVIVDIPHTREKTFQCSADLVNRLSWDELMVEAKTLYYMDDATRVEYTRTKSIMVVSERELISIKHFRELAEDKMLTVAFGTDLHNEPLRKGVIRAHAKLVCTLYESHAHHPHYSTVTQVNEIDLKGWIPSAVIKFGASVSVPKTIKKFRRVVGEYEG